MKQWKQELIDILLLTVMLTAIIIPLVALLYLLDYYGAFK